MSFIATSQYWRQFTRHAMQCLWWSCGIFTPPWGWMWLPQRHGMRARRCDQMALSRVWMRCLPKTQCLSDLAFRSCRRAACVSFINRRVSVTSFSHLLSLVAASRDINRSMAVFRSFNCRCAPWTSHGYGGCPGCRCQSTLQQDTWHLHPLSPRSTALYDVTCHTMRCHTLWSKRTTVRPTSIELRE